MAEKRRLPVLNRPPDAPEDEEPRPPWHWVGFGVVLTFAAWLPLAALAEALKGRALLRVLGPVDGPDSAARAMVSLGAGGRVMVVLLTVGLPVVAMAIGAAAAGYVVGRYGGTTRPREAGLAGAASAIVACALAWAASGVDLRHSGSRSCSPRPRGSAGCAAFRARARG
ncbi:MAG: hypothetical protein U0235_19975 [Polyangiaceae bacterium]